MLRFLIFFVMLGVRALRAIFRTREELLMENLALRQQVTALKRERPRPRLSRCSASMDFITATSGARPPDVTSAPVLGLIMTTYRPQLPPNEGAYAMVVARRKIAER